MGSVIAASLVAAPAGVQASTTTANSSSQAALSLATSDVTSDKEAARVDQLPTPTPDTFDCTNVFEVPSECGTVELPLDYDKPRGTQTEVAYLKVEATDPANKIGTLFVNPGGPSGSGVFLAADARFFLSPDVLAKFDIVGIDPRGTNFSDNVRCFENIGEAATASQGLNVPFPFTTREERAYKRSSKAVARGCSTTGKPLSRKMSTANVARDMEMMRRVVGDEQLNFLGFSYGSYLGNVYSNLYPDRVRAVAIDGVLDPVAWAGTPATKRIPIDPRLRSGEGAQRAIDEILRACKKAGPEKCLFATKGDPEANYDKILKELKENPLVITDPETGEVFFTLDYPTAIDFLLGDLYAPFAPEIVDFDLTFFYEDLFEFREDDTPEAQLHAEKATAFLDEYDKRQADIEASQERRQKTARALGYGFPYPNGSDAFYSVMCSDSSDPFYLGNWPTFAARADSTAPGFGPLWTWQSAPCAEKFWTARASDSYRGPFTANTVNPVLVVGNYWDPATNYDGAVTASSLLPNSRLLSSNNFGHTAYGTSACVTTAMDRYLLTTKVPRAGKLCKSAFPVFDEPLFEEFGQDLKSLEPEEFRADAEAQEEQLIPNQALPPVVPPIPGAIPRR
ncbi:MAG: alpha/beta hydrolase [Ornithinimicrobium sp.]